MGRWLTLVPVLTLGCAPTIYTHPDQLPGELEHARYFCAVEVQKYRELGNALSTRSAGPALIGFVVAESSFDKCMEGMGWTKQ